jgi:tetratricopeptide (TPR) repeat protein
LTIANQNPTDELKEELQMKLNLVSTIANLCYSIGLNANDYYILYTQYVIACFGEESFEASNCYFLLGCFFAEEGFFMKAVACFEKAAKIRGQFGGDCMYNIGILYKMTNNLPKALQTLSVAMKLRE